ncbi:MAG: hypothetical protein RJA70_1023 [Pseudomonadota bacterium]|jgi:hypothetical protein
MVSWASVSRSWRRGPMKLAVALSTALGCDSPTQMTAQISPVPSATPATASATPSAEGSAEPSLRGEWSGNYSSVPKNPMTQNAEGQRMSWIRDDGKRFTGSGQLTLSVSHTGHARGHSSGALGDLDLRGGFSPGAVSLQMRPKLDSPEAFSGTLLLIKTAAGELSRGEYAPGGPASGKPSEAANVGVLQLELRAASGDGKWVRFGTATLRKVKSP